MPPFWFSAFFQIVEKLANLPFPLNVQKTKMFQLQGLRFPDPLIDQAQGLWLLNPAEDSAPRTPFRLSPLFAKS